jgi:hypothetical protein
MRMAVMAVPVMIVRMMHMPVVVAVLEVVSARVNVDMIVRVIVAVVVAVAVAVIVHRVHFTHLGRFAHASRA